MKNTENIICKKCKIEIKKLENNQLINSEDAKIFHNPRRILEVNFPIKKIMVKLKLFKLSEFCIMEI